MMNRSGFYEQRAPFREKEASRGYHLLLKKYYEFLVPAGMRVLELGCGIGDLLATVRPSSGLGVDFSPATIALARKRHPELEFQLGDVYERLPDSKFDYIIVSDLLNDLPDVQAVLDGLHRHAFQHTRLVINSFNNLWRP